MPQESPRQLEQMEIPLQELPEQELSLADQMGFGKAMLQVELSQTENPVAALNPQQRVPVEMGSQHWVPDSGQVGTEILVEALQQGSMAVVFVFFVSEAEGTGLCQLWQKRGDIYLNIQRSHPLGSRLIGRMPLGEPLLKSVASS